MFTSREHAPVFLPKHLHCHGAITKNPKHDSQEKAAHYNLLLEQQQEQTGRNRETELNAGGLCWKNTRQSGSGQEQVRGHK